MAAELKVPSVGESITEVQVGTWLKQEGEYAALDEPIVELESEKATVEVPAPVAGIITRILKATGETAQVGEIIGHMEEAKASAADTPKPKAPESEDSEAETPQAPSEERAPTVDSAKVMPAAQRALAQKGMTAQDVSASGPGGRILKEDVLRHTAPASAGAGTSTGSREEEIVPMSPIRRTIASHLLNAQHQAALLTTFNEVDMSAVIALREKYKDAYLKKYDIKLGFMSFFVKASIEALKLVPEVNAEIRDDTIVYKNYYDIGIAIGGGKGLVVPVLRNAETMSFSEIEVAIADLGKRAKANKISMDELRGGTFSLTNGGIYGSMLSTPIVNPPQSAILGMHAIQDRPIAIDGEVVVRPIMYLAVTYDHRIVDGRGAVTFLKRIKDCLEDPARILIEI